MNEELSAAMDGEAQELERARVLRALSGDAALRQTWERYHLMGNVLRGEHGALGRPGVAGSVAAALVQEGAPQAAHPWRRAGTAVAGVALAASVAAVAIMLIRPVDPGAVPASAAATPAPVLAQGATPAAPAPGFDALLVRHGAFAPAAGMNGVSPYVHAVSGHRPASE